MEVESTRPKSSPDDSICSEDSSTFTNLSRSDLKQLQNKLDKVMYISQRGDEYYNALARIKKQIVVGVVTEPSELDADSNLFIIAFAGCDFIYIFDLLYLGGMTEDLKCIFKSKKPKKALHLYQREIDFCIQKYELKLALNTVKLYNSLTQKKERISFMEVVNKFFTPPHDYFPIRQADYDLYMRPLTDDQLEVIAKKVAFQYQLADYLLHDCMLKDFYNTCSDFMNTFEGIGDVDALMNIYPNSVYGYDRIQYDTNLMQNTQFK